MVGKPLSSGGLVGFGRFDPAVDSTCGGPTLVARLVREGRGPQRAGPSRTMAV